MRAQRFYADTRKFTVEDVPVPEPGPGEVLVKIAYCGICHSDLSLISGVVASQLPVVTQGHEASGVISGIGPDVRGWNVGDRVVVAAGRYCGACPFCREGNLMSCARIELMAFAYDGGWAEYTVSRASGLTRVPDNVPLDQAAILADAVATPFGAIQHTARVRVGESVGVWGIGGLGTHIVQLARLAGAAPILAVDPKPSARERALELGADLALDPARSDFADQVAALTGGKLLTTAFDAVGLNATVTQALRSVSVGGQTVVVGLSDQEATVGTTTAFGFSRKRLLGHLGYQESDIATLAALVSLGRVDLSRSISAVVSLEDVAEGVSMLQRGDDVVRVLVKP
ncbi:zinc-binding dehydrogenase [Streptomyces sp. NPDC057638]|uniref:zinc-binding dehydrogenase n=1 Tax=Streptomyces sp. NPDC057638 TaxID=3346190 RepID=UPI00368B80EF